MAETSERGLKVKLFGGFEISRDGTSIPLQTWVRGKAIPLLKILLTERGRPFTQDQLVDLLFSDLDPEKAAHNVHARISELRQALEPRLKKGTNSQFILNVGQQGYCFSKEAPCWLDTEEFQKQIEVAQVSEKAGRWPEALEIYQQAIQLYRGDYLAEDLYEEWALALREHWRELYLNALGRLAECHARMGQYERAIEQCAKVIEIKPASESAYRQQMLYHSLIGESSVALQTYQICIAVLKEQLRVEPSPETRELYEQILQGTVSKEGYPPPAGPARHNLPSSVTSFIGREREMVQIKQLLDMTRLLTLTGAGGSGKTRLALQVAAGLLKEYTDGVWLVELASLSDPSLVAQAVATAFGVREAPGRSLLERLSDYLHPKQLLLVLDNCEHLVEACAKVAEALLHACPDLQILATSREALGIAGETTWSVPPLAEPDSAQPLPTLKILKQYEAIGLFLERALSGQSQFAFTEQNARAVVQVCQRLDGLPLAIELAAARVKVLSVEEIAARLDDRFRLFVSGSRTALPHQQTLQATMDWSFQLLSEVERILLRRLSVFAGGWILEAAEAVCAGEGIEAREVLDLLAHLVDKSLVIGEQRDGKTRYRLLETVRQYAQEKLEESKESESLQSLHLTYFLQLTKQAEPELTGANQKQWLECFETELDNLRAALRWTWHAEPGAGLQLASALGQFWDVRGYWAEGRKVLGQAWERRADTQKEWHVKLLNWEGVLALRQGAYEESKRFCAESRALSQKIGDKQGFATSLHRLGVVALNQADYAGARNFLQESLTLRRELGDKHGIATSLHFLGLVALFNQADYAGARNFLQESLTLRRELGDKHGIALSLYWLSGIAYNQGQYAEARRFSQESLTLRRELGDKRGIAMSLTDLGNVAAGQGEYAEARSFLQESLTIGREIGHKLGIAWSLLYLGSIAADQGDYAEARRFSQESLTIMRETGEKRGIAFSLNSLGEIANNQGEYAEARRFSQESLTIMREIGEKLGIAFSLNSLGSIANNQGEYAEARRFSQESLTIRRKISDKWGIAASLYNLGSVAARQADYAGARSFFQESLTIRRELGHKLGMAASLEGLARLAYLQEQVERSAQLYGAAGALRETIGAPLPPAERAEYERSVAAVRAALGEEAFAVAWTQGREMTLDQAIQYALEK